MDSHCCISNVFTLLIFLQTEEEDEYGEEESTDDGMMYIILKMCAFLGLDPAHILPF